MKYNYGSIFRTMRENKNISISSLADEYVSKGMISKFERDECEISISRFFHLLEKIKVRPDEFFFSKNQYKSEGFGELLSIIQKSVLTGNINRLRKTLDNEIIRYNTTGDKYCRLNCIMLEAVISEISSDKKGISDEDLKFIIDYLFRCENWGHYELILYANSMSAFPIDSVIEFSKSVPQKILLMRESGRILEIGFNVILNTLVLCIKFNKRESSRYFLASLERLDLPETMLFEHALLKLHKGVYMSKFYNEGSESSSLIEEALSIFKLAGCLELYDIFLNNIEEMLV